MNMIRSFALCATSIACLAASGSLADAKSRFTVEYLFEEVAPHPDEYFFDERYDDEDAVTARGGDVAIYDEGPRGQLLDPDEEGFDNGFYEPKFQKPLTVKRKAAEKAVAKPKVGVVVTPKANQTILPGQAKVSSAVATKSSGGKVSCEKGLDIIKGYGFSDVKQKSCTGKVYAFTGTRSGKTYEILVSPGSGALTEVKRI
jgi:hypothetical protein